jgi:hypothetical protein
MQVKNTVAAIPISVVAASDLTGGYIAFTALPQACFMIRITSSATVNITVSYNGGTTDNDLLPAITNGYSVLQVNAQENSQPNGQIALFPKGMVIAVKGTVGTGSISLAGYYQPTGTL